MWIGLLIPATHFKPSRYITSHCYTCKLRCGWVITPHTLMWIGVLIPTTHFKPSRYITPTVTHALQTQQVHHLPLLHVQASVWVSNYTPYIDVDRITYPYNSLQTQQVHHPHCYTCKLRCGWVITRHTLMWIGLLIHATHFKPSRYITPTVTHALQTQQVHHPHCYTCKLQVNRRLDTVFRKIPSANSDKFYRGAR